MNISCEKRCGIINTIMDLRCRGCFDVDVNREAEGSGCDCKITIKSDRVWGWD